METITIRARTTKAKQNKAKQINIDGNALRKLCQRSTIGARRKRSLMCKALCKRGFQNNQQGFKTGKISNLKTIQTK